VAAGIDMALHLVTRLAGPAVAHLVQLDLEYNPAPPLGEVHPEPAELSAFTQSAAELEVALADHPELHARLIE
jgi:transcriptional regulator GlxA family with amidase domain